MPTVCLMLSSFIHWPASLLCWIYGCLLRVSCKEQRVKGSCSPTFYSISLRGWEHFPLQFWPPRRRRHPRISKNILEDIKVVGEQINRYFQIFSDILRYTAKRLGAFLLAVLAALSQVTSKNIKENLRKYKGCWRANKLIFSDILRCSKIYREAVRSLPTCSFGLLIAGDIREYRRKS